MLTIRKYVMCYETGIKLEIRADINMLLDYENGIRGGITRVIYYYAEVNNNSTYDYVESKESACITYSDLKNRYGWLCVFIMSPMRFK